MKQEQRMHILALSGSLRADSTNTTLVRAIIALTPDNLSVTLYDGLADLPHFSPDLDGDDAPPAVARLRLLLRDADGVLICTPEYAFGVPGSLKNALDWTVSSGEFDGKPVAALSASPSPSGGDKAHASLMLTLRALGTAVPAGAVLSIPAIKKKLDADGLLADAATVEALKTVLNALTRQIETRRAAPRTAGL